MLNTLCSDDTSVTNKIQPRLEHILLCNRVNGTKRKGEFVNIYINQ